MVNYIKNINYIYLVISFLFLILIKNSYISTYIYVDDTRFWDHGVGWTDIDLVRHYLSLGRPVFAIILFVFSSVIDSIFDLNFFKFTIALMNVVIGFLLMHLFQFFLCKRSALILAILYLLLPITFLVQTRLVVTAHVFSIFFTLISYYYILKIDQNQNIRENLKYYLFSFIFIMVSAFTYQASIPFFLFFTFLRILFDERINDDRKLINFALRDFTFISIITILYFLIHTYGFLNYYENNPHLGIRTPEGHHVWSITSEYLEKLNLLLHKLIPLSFTIFALYPSESILIFKIIIPAFFIILVYQSIVKKRSFKYVLTLIIIIMLIIVGSHVVNLVASNYYLAYRTMVGAIYINCIILFYVTNFLLNTIFRYNFSYLKNTILALLFLGWFFQNSNLVNFVIQNHIKQFSIFQNKINNRLIKGEEISNIYVSRPKISDVFGEIKTGDFYLSMFTDEPRGLSNLIYSKYKKQFLIAPFFTYINEKPMTDNCKKLYPKTIFINFTNKKLSSNCDDISFLENKSIIINGTYKHIDIFKGFDKRINSFWELTNNESFSVDISFHDKPIKIKSYYMKVGGSGKDSTERTPREWRLLGSNDRVNWILLDKQKLKTKYKNFEKRQFILDNNKSFKFYKFDNIKVFEGNILRIYDWGWST